MDIGKFINVLNMKNLDILQVDVLVYFCKVWQIKPFKQINVIITSVLTKPDVERNTEKDYMLKVDVCFEANMSCRQSHTQIATILLSRLEALIIHLVIIKKLKFCVKNT